MRRPAPGGRDVLTGIAPALAAAGADLTLEAPGLPAVPVGRRPGAARVVFRDAGALERLGARDLLGLAEAYLAGRIEVEGDFLEAVKVTEVIAPGPGLLERLGFALRGLLRDRRALQRESVAFHYDRPADFFLPWFERWRSYSHGFYASPDDAPEVAQARKLQYALDALGAKPGQRIFDMGCGWGSFLEYAGLRGVHVHGITLSREQHRFVDELIRARGLPCTVECVDFLDHRPDEPYDGAVFMGTLEHFSDYRFASRFLARHLAPAGRVYADFCTAPGGTQAGAFLSRHIFPGPARYVDVPRLLAAIEAAGLCLHVLADDTRSYACSCRDWAEALDRAAAALAAAHGPESVRAFRVFLRASQHFLETGRTRAYHLVAGREGRPLEGPAPDLPAGA